MQSVAFLVCFGAILCGAWVVAACFPLRTSLIAVLLFAGPHNWIEARYFLSRLPARWGKLKPFFVWSMMGVVGLTMAFAALPILSRRYAFSMDAWLIGLSLWNSAFILWVVLLVCMRRQTPPRRAWPYAWPMAFCLLGLAWCFPGPMSIAWVYLHPLMGIWILDREMARTRFQPRLRYRWLLLLIPFGIVGLVAMPSLAMDLSGTHPSRDQVIAQTGAAWLPGLPLSMLLSLHAFLELIHYGVWIIAIPWVSQRVWQFPLAQMPLARRSIEWKRGVQVVIGFGALMVLGLWIGFSVNYAATRDVYFTIAMLHVLAEVPFLLRSL